MNAKKLYTIGLTLGLLLAGTNSYATNTHTLNQASGTISLTTGYVDDMDEVWDINTGTADKPVTMTFDANIEEGCDYIYIYAVDNANITKPVKEISGTMSGVISTVLPNGKAKIVFHSDESVSSSDGYSGFTLSFAVDNANNTTISTNTYTTGNAIVDGKVGIGTLGPRENLDVDGSAIFNNNVGIGTPINLLARLNISLNHNTTDAVYGVLSNAYNSGGPVYGISSNVGGVAGKKWAGYFNGGAVAVMNGSVGIGTATPTQALNVIGRVAIAPSSTVSDEGYNGNLIITKPVNSGQYINLVRRGQYPWSIGTIYNSSFFAIGTGTASDAAFTAPFFTINTDGNVGIGTPTPQGKLQINAEGDPNNQENNTNNGIQINGSNQILYMGVNSNSHVSYIQSVYSGSLSTLLLNARGGNVGIGTVSPISNLDITVPASGSPIHAMTINVSSFGTTDNQLLSDYFKIADLGNSAFTPFIIKGNGNVGIGTANPQNALDVKGTIRAAEVKVESVGKFADFVFEKGYALPCLEDVNQYIEDNGHLPNIPSAQEVKENGMSLVEMQVKLLQKVEELTLYSIQQQKEIQSLKSEINGLKR